MSEFVDTNVLGYAWDKDSVRKREASLALLSRLFEDEEGVISTQVLIEFYSVLTRKLKAPAQLAEDALRDYAGWEIHRPDFASVMSAVQLQRRYQLSWFDAMIVNSAIESGCSILWTEDLADGQKFGGLTIRNPYQNNPV